MTCPIRPREWTTTERRALAAKHAAAAREREAGSFVRRTEIEAQLRANGWF